MNIRILAASALLAITVGCASTSTKLQPATPVVQSAAPQQAASPAASAVQTAPAPAASKSVAPTTRTERVDPSTFRSLQPFTKFAKGEGEGVAREYKSRDKADIVRLLRDKAYAKREMRVSCEVFVRQMVEAHPGLPFEGCEGAAAAIEHDDNFTVVPCQDQMFTKDNWLAVTNEQGSAFGVWHRKCLVGERVLVYNGEPLFSTKCLNVAVPVTRTEVVPAASASKSVAASAVPESCPNGYMLYANAWELSKLPDDLRKQAEALIAAAERRNSKSATAREEYEPVRDDLSRTLGGKLRREVKTRAPWTLDVQVQLRDPQTIAVLQSLGTLRLENGLGSIALTEKQHGMIVETIWPADFKSPAMSGSARRLWLFPSEWGTCAMNVHGAK